MNGPHQANYYSTLPNPEPFNYEPFTLTNDEC
jgi:hypothetical protein